MCDINKFNFDMNIVKVLNNFNKIAGHQCVAGRQIPTKNFIMGRIVNSFGTTGLCRVGFPTLHAPRKAPPTATRNLSVFFGFSVRFFVLGRTARCK